MRRQRICMRVKGEGYGRPDLDFELPAYELEVWGFLQSLIERIESLLEIHEAGGSDSIEGSL